MSIAQEDLKIGSSELGARDALVAARHLTATRFAHLASNGYGMTLSSLKHGYQKNSRSPDLPVQFS
jgi:hypothetical protein